MGSSFGMGMSGGAALAQFFGSSGSNPAAGYGYNPATGLMALQKNNYDQNAALHEEQAGITLDEAESMIDQKAREAHDFRENQAVQYANAGVLMAGTPAIVANKTVQLAGQEIDALGKRGAAFAGSERRQAAMVRNQGMAAMLGAESQFNTRKAQAQMAAIRSDSPFGDLIMGLGSAFSSGRGGKGFNFGFGKTASGTGAGSGFAGNPSGAAGNISGRNIMDLWDM